MAENLRWRTEMAREAPILATGYGDRDVRFPRPRTCGKPPAGASSSAVLPASGRSPRVSDFTRRCRPHRSPRRDGAGSPRGSRRRQPSCRRPLVQPACSVARSVPDRVGRVVIRDVPREHSRRVHQRHGGGADRDHRPPHIGQGGSHGHRVRRLTLRPWGYGTSRPSDTNDCSHLLQRARASEPMVDVLCSRLIVGRGLGRQGPTQVRSRRLTIRYRMSWWFRMQLPCSARPGGFQVSHRLSSRVVLGLRSRSSALTRQGDGSRGFRCWRSW